MWTQSTSVTDRQTDGQTDRITITDTVQRIASHGKKPGPQAGFRGGRERSGEGREGKGKGYRE